MILPAPLIGTTLAMLVPATEGMVGQSIYIFAKLWIIATPALWHRYVLKEPWSLSPARRGGFLAAGALGCAIAVIIVAAYFLIGHHVMDAESVRAEAMENGIGTPARFLLFALFVCGFNSLMEEYVWRWFVFRQWETLSGTKAAVVLSALFFTLHHVLALSAQFGWLITALGSIGVFVGGATWSWCYQRFGSIWPGYVSHLIVDAAILWIGWRLVFGS